MLFKLGRKLSTSGTLLYISELYSLPISIKFLFYIIGFNINKKKKIVDDSSTGEKLCDALQEMGTTFIKLGQFLATRPDIIGENVAKNLEKLQDKLTPFDQEQAKNILKDQLGKEKFSQII